MVVQIHANNVLNDGLVDFSEFVRFRFGAVLAKRANSSGRNCTEMTMLRISAMVVQIHANSVLNDGDVKI